MSPPMSARIRAAAAEDAEALARLHADGFDRPWTSADFGGWLLRPDGFGQRLTSLDGPQKMRAIDIAGQSS